MNLEPTTTATTDTQDEISALVTRLIETEQRLLELTQGQVDAIMDPGGRSYLFRQAQEKLLQSEAAQRQLADRQLAILDALPANIALIDGQGVIVSVNAGWRHFAGANALQDSAAAVGQNYLQICERVQDAHATEAQQVAAGIRSVLTGATKSFELEYPCHSPMEQRWFRLIVTPVVENHRTGAVVMHVDITEQRRTEDVLRESEARFSGAFERAPIGKALVSPAGRFLKVNRALCNLVGYPEAELLTRTFQDITHPEDLAADLEFVRRMLAGEIQTYQMEKRYVHKLGQPVAALLNVSLVRDAEGQPIYFIAQIQDITERKQAEAVLAYERDLLRALLENSPDHIYFKDAQSRFIKSSTAQARQFGQGSPEALVGRTDFDFFTEAHARPAFEEEQEIIRTGVPMIGRVEKETWQDGRPESWVLTTKMPLRDKDGKTIGTFGVSKDITAIKLAEAKLTESQQRLALATKSAHVGIWDWDVAANKMAWDTQMYELYGIRVEEFRGEVAIWKERLHPEDRGRAEAEIADALAGRKDFNSEFRVVWPGGEVRHIEAHALVQRAPDGSALRMIGANWDITERKRTEEAIKRLAAIIESSDDAIISKTLEGVITSWNPAAERMFGYTAAEIIGRPLNASASPDRNEKETEILTGIAKGNLVWHFETIRVRKDGQHFDASVTISPIKDTDGKVVGLSKIIRDITERRKLEEQLRQSQKMEAIGQLAGGVAHDFNNILAIIQMQVGLLKADGGLSSEQLDCATDIEKSSQRAADLTRQLLMFSRRQTLQPRDLDLNDAITNITKMLHRILGEDIQMQLKYAPQPLFIHADPGMIDQILMNLTVNSRDAMPKGGQLIIETAAVEFDKLTALQSAHARPGSFVCLSVSDTGGGIPPEILPRIFEPFFTTKDVGKGTGLGLATVFGIVQQHQGWIHVYSEAGHGTTFRIYLPRLAVVPGQIRPVAMPEPARGGSETILLVEDDSALRVSVRNVLSRLGYRVLESTDGASAIKTWRQNRDEIQLLLTDMVMPDGMSGKKLAEQLLQENPKLKVIYSSGYSAEVASKDFPLNEGVNFLAKPFEAHRLGQTVRHCLDRITPA